MLRVHEPARDEWRDAIDARWTRFLARCGIVPLYLPNDPGAARQLLERARPAGALLTGGGTCSALGTPPDDRDRTEALVLDWAEHGGRPVLGVCRGMQVMLALAGGRLERVPHHVARHHRVAGEHGARQVNSYHEFGLRDVPAGYVAQTHADDGVVESVRHAHRRAAALMWHPERTAPFDDADIHAFRHFFGDAS